MLGGSLEDLSVGVVNCIIALPHLLHTGFESLELLSTGIFLDILVSPGNTRAISLCGRPAECDFLCEKRCLLHLGLFQSHFLSLEDKEESEKILNVQLPTLLQDEIRN